MKKSFVIAVAAVVGVAGYAETTPRAVAVEAAPRSLEQVRENALKQMAAGELVEVQKRGRSFRGGKRAGRSFRGGRNFRGGRGWRGGRYGYRRGYGGRRYYRGNRRGYGGAAVAAGIVGLAVGAAVASSARGSGRSRSWCASRYKSYDPRSGTYLGYDGRRHACP